MVSQHLTPLGPSHKPCRKAVRPTRRGSRRTGTQASSLALPTGRSPHRHQLELVPQRTRCGESSLKVEAKQRQQRKCQQWWENKTRCVVVSTEVFSDAPVLGQDCGRGLGCCKSFLAPYFSRFVFSVRSSSACCSISCQKTLISLHQPDLLFFCLELTTWASPKPWCLSFLIARATDRNFIFSQDPSCSTNFISYNHKISNKPTENLRIYFYIKVEEAFMKVIHLS